MESHISLEKRGGVAEDSPSRNQPHLGTRDVDVAAELAAGNDFVLGPEEAARIRCFCRACCYPDQESLTTARADERSIGISCRCCAVSTYHLLSVLSVACADNPSSPQSHICARQKNSCHTSSTHCFVLRRMQFADKTTLGQAAVLGLLCVHRCYISCSFSGCNPNCALSHLVPGLIIC